MVSFLTRNFCSGKPAEYFYFMGIIIHLLDVLGHSPTSIPPYPSLHSKNIYIYITISASAVKDLRVLYINAARIVKFHPILSESMPQNS